MIDFLQLLIAGITTGSVYGIIALTFTLIYNATKVINFAQGEFVMIGAMVAVYLLGVLKLSPVEGLIAVPLIVSLVGIALDRLIINPLRKRGVPIVNQIMATLAAAIVISNSVAVIAGKSRLGVPPQFGENPLRYAGLSILPQNLGVILITFIAVLALWFFFKKTILGLTILATGYNRDASKLMGIRVTKVIIVTFALSAAVSGLAGAIIAPIISASAYMGLQIAIKGFIAAIVGGMGNPAAALIGGMGIGLAESLVAGYISSAFNEVIALGIMLVVLIIRPTGIIAEVE